MSFVEVEVKMMEVFLFIGKFTQDSYQFFVDYKAVRKKL